MLLPSIISLKFLLLLYDNMGGSGKHFITSCFICSIFQSDLGILLIFERVGLNVVVVGIHPLVLIVLHDSVFFLDFVLALSIWCVIKLSL